VFLIPENLTSSNTCKGILQRIGGTHPALPEDFYFWPNDARNELVNLLHKDHVFDGIKIAMESTDKMTEPQIRAFVRNRFSRH
jgi:hypothetical protein